MFDIKARDRLVDRITMFPDDDDNDGGNKLFRGFALRT